MKKRCFVSVVCLVLLLCVFLSSVVFASEIEVDEAIELEAEKNFDEYLRSEYMLYREKRINQDKDYMSYEAFDKLVREENEEMLDHYKVFLTSNDMSFKEYLKDQEYSNFITLLMVIGGLFLVFRKVALAGSEESVNEE
ncbi:hypothetical protein IKF81_02080 [Candidatus Saccharibacteria bacterium]|nr:hypothetical protein [Candidatus Saccharibacteria bacterium]